MVEASSGIAIATGIFRYLAEYTQLRMRQQRTLDMWDASWAKDWPNELEVGSAFRLGERELGTGVLLVVKKPKRTPPPLPREDRLVWFDRPSLSDSSLSEPKVFPQIRASKNTEALEGEPSEEEQEILNLAENPEVLAEIRRYVSDRWLPWAETDRRRVAVQSLYGTLFSWWQRQTQMGEQWELILGLGLLTWKDRESADIIKRPLVVVPATVEMDARSGAITVSIQSDGSGPALELDMLSPGQRPNADAMRSMRVLVTKAGDVWDRSVGNGVLRAIANQLAADAVYDEADDYAASYDNAPRVAFAPGLFMRKRTEKSVHSLLLSIERQLAETGYVPPGIAAVLGIDDDVDPKIVETGEVEQTQSRLSSELIDEMVFFPKKSNDEQKMIVRKLAASRGGLIVQGPPGTGKSHTIANLVCDLLARGNRVLVTSKGPRALRVLRDMLPEEVQDLCVLMLGADLESNQSLEKSIGAISKKYESWQPARAAARRAQLREEYESSRSMEQRILGEMLELREAETEQEVAVADAYVGTRAHIAAKVRSEEDRHGWILQYVKSDADPGDLPIGRVECRQLADDLASVTEATANELALCRPDLGSLPSTSELQALFDEQRAAWAALDASASAANEVEWTEELANLRGSIAELRNSLLHVSNSGQDSAFVLALARECIDGDGELLREEISFLDDVLGRLGAESAVDAEVVLPEGVTWSQARVDASRLSAHLHEGKGMGFGLLRPKVVKECMYLIEGARVDGVACSDVVVLDRLAAAISDKQILASARDRLTRHGLSPDGSPRAELTELRLLRRRAQTAVASTADVSRLRGVCEKLPMGFVIDWTSIESLQKALDALDFSARKFRLDQVTERIDSIAAEIRGNGQPLHPQATELADAVASRDISRAEAAHEALVGLSASDPALQRVTNLKKRLAERNARLADALVHWGDERCVARVRGLVESWSWLRAELWLRRVCDPKRHEDLDQELECAQQRQAGAISALAAEFAWEHCLSPMTEEHRRHLVAWSLAMRKLGKGTGKYASIHRRDAREHMQYCKDVIPAWIMPLYKVAETLDPQPNTFDVAIVDEASQSGPEALFVAYIAKKVIIVGDDQQISPDDVGVNVQDVQDLIDLYLSELPYKGVFGAKSSLFDQGKQFFGYPLRLREHFRCMPEIIQFSNNLCYADQPLDPLRQYGPDRLDPVVVRRIADGYQEDGRGSVNPPEANAIVRQIAELCNDPRYDGRTFGVISLLSSSKQAQLIERRLLETIGAEEMIRRRIVCGDAYDFQGDERDVVFLSMVSASNHRVGSLTSEADKRRFNVAVSRAKDQLWLFHSIDIKDLGSTCYRRVLLEYCQNPRVTGITSGGIDVEAIRRAAQGRRELGNQPTPFGSWFEVDVYLQIADKGFRVLPQYESGGYFIDLMVQGMNGSLAVECDGEKWHGAEQYEADVARQRKLERCGLRFWRLAESAFRRDPKGAMESLWTRLADLRIYSEAEDAAHQEETSLLAKSAGLSGGDATPGTVGSDSCDAFVDSVPAVYTECRLGAGTQTFDQPHASPSTTRDGAVSASGSRASSGLRTYSEWPARRLSDPRTASRTMIQAGLLEVLQAEGPMCVDRLYHVYAREAGIQRVKDRARAELDAAMSALARSGDISRRTETLPGYDGSMNVAWVAGKPDVVVRQRGPRELEEIPLTEIVEALALLGRRAPSILRSREAAVRAMQNAYALGRVSAKARERFEAAARKLSMAKGFR